MRGSLESETGMCKVTRAASICMHHGVVINTFIRCTLCVMVVYMHMAFQELNKTIHGMGCSR